MKTSFARPILYPLLVLVSFNSVVFAQDTPPSYSSSQEIPRATLAAQGSMQPPDSMPEMPQTRSDYLLSSGDLVHVKIFQEDDLESWLRISNEGAVTFPLVGVVKIGGMTARGASEAIRAALKRYLVNPQVNLTVTEYTKRRFTVLGQVQKPGSYEMPDRDSLTLLQAIGMAGGYTHIANPSKIILKRSGKAGDQVIKINAGRMAKDNSVVAMPILPGDVISVGESIF